VTKRELGKCLPPTALDLSNVLILDKIGRLLADERILRS